MARLPAPEVYLLYTGYDEYVRVYATLQGAQTADKRVPDKWREQQHNGEWTYTIQEDGWSATIQKTKVRP